MLTEVNKDTALNPENALGEGQILKWSVVTAALASLTPNGAWLDPGWFPDGTYLLPKPEIDKAPLMAAGREDGSSVEIATRIKSSKVTYDIPLLTADSRTRTIWRATPKVVAEDGPLKGIRAYKINRGAVVVVRQIFIKKRPDGSWTVTFHPRFELSNDGKDKGDGGNEILKFVGSVRSYPYTPSAALQPFVAALDDFGGEFEGDTPQELDLVLSALDREALDTVTLTSGQAVTAMKGDKGSTMTYTVNIAQPSKLDIVASGGTGNLDIRIKDATGKVVGQGNAADDNETITVDTLPAGTYTVDVIGTDAYEGASLTATTTPV